MNRSDNIKQIKQEKNKKYIKKKANFVLNFGLSAVLVGLYFKSVLLVCDMIISEEKFKNYHCFRTILLSCIISMAIIYLYPRYCPQYNNVVINNGIKISNVSLLIYAVCKYWYDIPPKEQLLTVVILLVITIFHIKKYNGYVLCDQKNNDEDNISDDNSDVSGDTI
jgi:hypothetical protein